uniref:C-type lectin domain-containing protein n=1 Tax=Maylandia zebra TaxID=106582 RepID=A0A3P9BII6_9CICH
VLSVTPKLLEALVFIFSAKGSGLGSRSHLSSAHHYSCYMHNAVTMTWADAELHCVSEGTNLVSIHGENVFTWIGLGDIHKEGRWMWSDGSQVSFELWGQGKETCAHINFGPDVIWNDLDSYFPLFTFTFICGYYVSKRSFYVDICYLMLLFFVTVNEGKAFAECI